MLTINRGLSPIISISCVGPTRIFKLAGFQTYLLACATAGTADTHGRLQNEYTGKTEALPERALTTSYAYQGVLPHDLLVLQQLCYRYLAIL